MADLAKLAVTFTADPSPVRKAVGQASKDVQGLANAAKDAAKATDRAFDGVRFPGMSKAAERFERDWQRMEKQMGGFSGASQRMVVEFGKIEAAADAMGRTVVGVNVGFDGIGTASGSAAAGLSNFTSGFARAGAAAGAANQNIKLTSGQVQGLGYQINDIGTMLALGASPFQILASQAGQVIQVLQEGGGIKSSLGAIGTAIGGVLQAIGPMRLAIGAAAAAAGAFWYMSREDKAETAKKAIESYDEAVRSLKGSLGEAANAVGQLFDVKATDSLTISLAKTQGSIVQLKASLAASIDQLGALPGLSPDGGTIGSASAVVGNLFGTQFSRERASLQELYSQLAQGKMTADQFADSVATIRLDPATSLDGKKLADTLLSGADAARLTEARIGSLGTVVDEAAVKALRLGDAFRGAMETLRGFAPDTTTTAEKIANAFDEATSSARTYGEVMGAAAKANAAMAELARPAQEAARAAEQRAANLSLSPDQRGIADIRQRYAAEIAEMERVDGSAEAIAAKRRERDAEVLAATIEIRRAEEARRAGYALELQSVNDITAAQKAQTAGQRAYIDAIAAGYDKTYAAARSAEASTLSMSQARQRLEESTRQQTTATERQIEQAQLEYDLIGKSAAEAARLRTEFELLAQAKAAARSAGFDEATVSLTDEMKRQAAEVGRLTEATQRLNFERETLFDRQQAGRSPEDQRIASELRSYGIEFDSAQGRADAAQLRLNDRLHETNDRLYEMRDAGKEAFGDLISSIGSGKDALSAFAQAFAGIGKQLATAGFDRIFKGLFGDASGAATGGSAGGSLAGALQTIATAGTRIAANTNLGGSTGYIPTPTARPEYLGQAAAAVSGQVMTYAKRFNSGVDTRLMAILKEASANFPMRVEAMSGLRPGDPRFHGKGLATDVRIFDASGKALSNYQDGSTFRVYEQFAQQAKVAQEKLFPELGKLFRWGGYFSGAKGRYGALDTMHFDLGGAGMAGGSWENGLSAAQRRIWGGAQSVGMGSRTADQRVVAQGVSQGMMDYSRRAGPESYGAGRFDDAGAGSIPQMSRGQAGFGALAGLAGLFGAGSQSGNPVMGGLSGALGGLELGAQFGPALGLGAAAGSVGLIAGAPAGRLGTLIPRKETAA